MKKYLVNYGFIHIFVVELRTKPNYKDNDTDLEIQRRCFG